MNLIDELEKLREQIANRGDWDVEETVPALLPLLYRLLEEKSITKELNELTIACVSDFPDKLKFIEEKKREVKLNDLREDKEELQKLLSNIRQNVVMFFYGTDYKRYRELKSPSSGTAEDKLQSIPSSPVFSNIEKKAKMSEIPQRENKISALDPRLVLELADKFVSREDSPTKRIEVASEIYVWATGREAEINVSLQRA